MSAEADIFSDARFHAKMFAVHTCLLLVFAFVVIAFYQRFVWTSFLFSVALDRIIHRHSKARRANARRARPMSDDPAL